MTSDTVVLSLDDQYGILSLSPLQYEGIAYKFEL